MLFFVTYTANMNLYRKTSKALVFFVAVFILGQYFFSLEYHNYENSHVWMERFEWLGFYDKGHAPDWKQGSSIFFRHKPKFFDWAVLLLMNLLNLINYLFQDKEEVAEMDRICYEGIREKYTDALYNAMRFKNFIQSNLIFVVLAVLLYFIAKAQVNLISWIFFILNMMMLSFIAKGDGKESTNKHIKQVCTIIKTYSTIILVADIIFICFVGERPKPDQPGSLDQELSRRYKFLYSHLDLIGLRLYLDAANLPSEEAQRLMLRTKFYSYIAYLMVSIYLEATYSNIIEK